MLPGKAPVAEGIATAGKRHGHIYLVTYFLSERRWETVSRKKFCSHRGALNVDVLMTFFFFPAESEVFPLSSFLAFQVLFFLDSKKKLKTNMNYCYLRFSILKEVRFLG